MEEIVTILSTREWAIVIWGTGFFVWMLTQSEIRKSLWNVIKILLGKNLRHFFLIIALYVAGITMIFYQLPFWNNIYLKDIILWLIFSGISYCVNSIIKGDAEHLKSTVKDNFIFVDMKEKGLSKGEFNSVCQAVGGYEKLIDQECKDKDLLALITYLAEEDKAEKILENQKMIKTPIVRNGKQATVGYRPDVWKNWK